MPAPRLGTPPAPVPQLRVIKAGAVRASHASSLPWRKLAWGIVIAALGVAIVAAIRAGWNEDTDPDQAWFWRPEWLGGEMDAERELASGQGTAHESDEDFQRSLLSRMKPE